MFSLIQKISVVGLALFIVGCTTTVRKSNFNLYSNVELKEDYAILYVYRNNAEPTLMPVEIKLDNSKIVGLKDKEFTKIYVKPYVLKQPNISFEIDGKSKLNYTIPVVSTLSSKWFIESQMPSKITINFVPKNVYYIKLTGQVSVEVGAFRQTTYLDSKFNYMQPNLAKNELSECCVYKKPIVEYYDLNK